MPCCRRPSGGALKGELLPVVSAVCGHPISAFQLPRRRAAKFPPQVSRATNSIRIGTTPSRPKARMWSANSGRRLTIWRTGKRFWLRSRPTEWQTGKSSWLTQRRTGRRPRSSGMPTTAPTMWRTGKSGWLTWWLIRLPAARPGSRPNERRLTFPLAAGPARLQGSGPNLRPVASLVRQHHHTDPLRPDGQEGRRAPLAPGQGPRPQHPRPPRRRWRCIALIFDFLNHRTGRLTPVAAKAGVCVRTIATALKRLRERGILNWVRRCAERWADGRFACWSRRPTPLPCCGAIGRHRRPHRPLRATWGERTLHPRCQRSPRRLRRPSLQPRRTCWRSAVPAMPGDPQDRPRPWPPRLI